MRRVFVYAGFLLLVLGGGLLVGAVARPDGWYAALVKPAFNPPSWVFAPAWTLLYVLVAVAGARTFEVGARLGLALWTVQLLLNFSWSPVFFGLHRQGTALVIVIALLAAILVFVAERWRSDNVAAWLFVPYAAWVGFASLLNGAIVRLN